MIYIYFYQKIITKFKIKARIFCEVNKNTRINTINFPSKKLLHNFYSQTLIEKTI